MKLRPIVFSLLMFTILFGVPVTQVFIEDDSALVFQEAEEKDAEEGEDIQLKDALEKLYYSNEYGSKHLLAITPAQLQSGSLLYSFVSQKLGVDTPPPEFS